jgi:hypothetical protein
MSPTTTTYNRPTAQPTGPTPEPIAIPFSVDRDGGWQQIGGGCYSREPLPTLDEQ